jgi:hypothetical protein
VIVNPVPTHLKKVRGFMGTKDATLIITLFTCVVFLGVNPYLWPHPVERIVKMFRNRVDEMENQKGSQPQARIDTISERAKRVPKRVFRDYAAIDVKGYFSPNIAFIVVGLYRALSKSWEWLVDKVSDSSAIAILLVG